MSLSSSFVSMCLISRHLSALLLSPGLRCAYHQQHLVIFNYNLSSDQQLMGLEEEEREGHLERNTALPSTPPPSDTTNLSCLFFWFWFTSIKFQTPSVTHETYQLQLKLKN